MVKNLPTSERHIRDAGSISGLERSPGREHDNPLQYCFQKNPTDRSTGELQSMGLTEVT